MKFAVLFLIVVLCLVTEARADVEPAVAHTPITEAWIGQRAPFYIELRSPGSFSGTARFDLPQIPGTLVIKIGEPVVESQKLEGETWFVQRHEFAMFCQRAGTLEVPAFVVRFSRRAGFTGPASEVRAQTEALTIEIRQPPGSEAIGYLVTTESLEITEIWDPQPGPAEVGSVFKRTVLQTAEHLPGMALASIPTDAPDGIRVYPGAAETRDQLARGKFIGEREELITYLLQKPGTLELPALKYVWWNPKTQTLESKTLSALTIEVSAPSVSPASEQAATSGRLWPCMWALLVVLAGWKRHRIQLVLIKAWQTIHPPSRRASRQLLRACARNEPVAARNAWLALMKSQDNRFQSSPDLLAALLGLQRAQFGPPGQAEWTGDDLALAFRRDWAAVRTDGGSLHPSDLPLLNP